jgi:predicted nicotinamide N-methyase
MSNEYPLELQIIRVKQTTTKLFVPDVTAIQQAYNNGLIAFPYWSQVWPSSIALSEFIIDNSHLVQNKNLLELGAGLGLPSLISSSYAASVLCSDKDADAVEIISKSAAENNISNLQSVMIDWEVPFEINADVLLLSDINYEPEIFQKLNELIFRFIKNGTTILLATPHRLMAKPFIGPLLKFCVRQEEIIVTDNEKTAITVLVLSKESTPFS